jgi:uncharacterized membrane protein
MGKSILGDLQELLDAGVIDNNTAEKIRSHYSGSEDKKTSRLLIVFGILGALVTGMGLILIFAHNWDTLPKNAKLIISFLPLLTGQIWCATLLFRSKLDSIWKEAASVFLFIGIAVAISLISQIYNLSENFTMLLVVWMILGLPVVYLMKSSIASLLYIVLASWVSWLHQPVLVRPFYLYFVLLALIAPFVFSLYQKNRNSNFFIFHCWVLVISFTSSAGAVVKSGEEWLMPLYIFIFSTYIFISNAPFLVDSGLWKNPFRLVGNLGVLVLFFVLTFDFYWDAVDDVDFIQESANPEFIFSAIMLLISTALFIKTLVARKFSLPKAGEAGFIFFIIAFILAQYSVTASLIAMNIYLLAHSLVFVKAGAEKGHLGILNFGLAILSVLIACRFFDTDMSFVVRGLLFIGLGLSFFVANYKLVQNRKKLSNDGK